MSMKEELHLGGRGMYGTFSTKQDRYLKRKEIKAKDPSVSFQPLFSGITGIMPRNYKQQVMNLIGPVYDLGQLSKLLRQLKDTGRIQPNFHLIKQGKNAGKYREIETQKPTRWLHHRG